MSKTTDVKICNLKALSSCSQSVQKLKSEANKQLLNETKFGLCSKLFCQRPLIGQQT